MVYPFPLCKQLYSIKEEKESISFIPGVNYVLLLSNGILRNAHNNNSILRKRQIFSGLCFEYPKFYMLKGTVIRKHPAAAFIK